MQMKALPFLCAENKRCSRINLFNNTQNVIQIFNDLNKLWNFPLSLRSLLLFYLNSFLLTTSIYLLKLCISACLTRFWTHFFTPIHCNVLSLLMFVVYFMAYLFVQLKTCTHISVHGLNCIFFVEVSLRIKKVEIYSHWEVRHFGHKSSF